jgi:type IV pilus assembly protein PilX
MQACLISRNNQSGAVLLVGLIMLLLLTIIGLSSIRGADLQERMAGNLRDRNLAFQSTEAALRMGETIKPPPATWTDLQWVADAIEVPTNTLDGVSASPFYVIEQIIVPLKDANPGSGVDQESTDKLGGNSEYYRLTAKGVGGTAGSQIILQSTYRR